ncbi:MAG: PKD repeat protein [Flavobacteriaceae bacterium]|jgi:PKD repeat protein
MIRLNTLIISLFFSITLTAQDSVSVLFIGNSYTYVNALPDILVNLSTSLGDVVNQDSHTGGGATLQGHAGNPAAYAKINAQPWDYVVLQAQSQEPSFSDSQVDAETLPYAKQLADSIYANRFCSEALFFMTWGRENGDPQWAPIATFDGMNGRLRNAYLRMSDTIQGSVSPVGVAWKEVRDNYPAINLYSGDGSHPSYEGSYLAACTFYASVFRKSPIGATFYGALDPVTAGILQDVASYVVLDSLSQWNLRALSEHTQADYLSSVTGTTVALTNTSTKAQSYAWDFGDGMSSTDEHPSNTFAVNGTYSVTLIAESPCDLDTITMNVNIGVTEISEHSTYFHLATFGDGHYQISTEMKVLSMKILDPIGREILREANLSKEIVIDLSQKPSGIYSVILETSETSKSIRLIK